MIPGFQIKKFRRYKDLKQEVVACNLNISQQAYAKIESMDLIKIEKLPEILAAMQSCEKEWRQFIEFITPPPEK